MQVTFDGGRVRKDAELFGPLPGLLQEVPAADAFAFLMFLRHAGVRPHVYHTDCQWVLDSFLGGRESCTGSMHAHADVWRSIWNRLDDIGPGQVEVAKVKAHVTLLAVQEGRACPKQRLANSWADLAAKAGARLHPRCERASARVRRTTILVKRVATYLARLYVQHERHGAQAKSVTEAYAGGRRAVAARRVHRHRHQVRLLRLGMWRCSVCLRTSKRQATFAREACRAGWAHRLWQVGQYIFCASCGGYSKQRRVLLRTGCRGRLGPGRGARLRRLWAGRCPTTDVFLGERPAFYGAEASDRSLGSLGQFDVED